MLNEFVDLVYDNNVKLIPQPVHMTKRPDPGQEILFIANKVVYATVKVEDTIFYVYPNGNVFRITHPRGHRYEEKCFMNQVFYGISCATIRDKGLSVLNDERQI